MGKEKQTITLQDYKIAYQSRCVSKLAHKEVLNGKAKFGIFGDGKELPQIAMAKIFKKGDFRSGYYRDQTFMFAIGAISIKEYFAQLYAHADVSKEPASGGRMMNAHFGSRTIDENGEWRNLAKIYNIASDISPNAGQMPRLLGLAYASKLFRNNPELKNFTNFSNYGSEIAFGTIGNAATSEGSFFETINAAGVLQVPIIISVWDDDYGISVPKEYHTTKYSISEALQGFELTNSKKGIKIFKTEGWNYEKLIETYLSAEKICRTYHIPILIHITELTQPQGHSTSGSHERYKSDARLTWEKQFDCLVKFRNYVLEKNLINQETLEKEEKTIKEEVYNNQQSAWQEFRHYHDKEKETALNLLDELFQATKNKEIPIIIETLNKNANNLSMHLHKSMSNALFLVKDEKYLTKKNLIKWFVKSTDLEYKKYHSHLYSESKYSALNVTEIPSIFSEESIIKDGKDLLKECFDNILSKYSEVFFIGEDIGLLGDVNQSLVGMQKKYGKLRVTDTGIRETTIIGQAIGAAMRGLRPIAEIQYLDYLPYALQTLSDDLATLRHRTAGGQKAPVIIRTRGHRLEGMWHSGSLISTIIGATQGIYLLTPRNMLQAAGFYNTMLKSDDSAIIIECLNGYRLKETVPDNLTEVTIPIGKTEIIKKGSDITIVTYGSMCRIALQAAEYLEKLDISCEIIDVQSIIPFDLDHSITESLKKTGNIIFTDECIPGGTSAYMMQKVLEEQEGFKFLKSSPKTISSSAHRPVYGDDGNYFSKPNINTLIKGVYTIMSQQNSIKFPPIS